MRAWAGKHWRRMARLGTVGLLGVGLLSLGSCVADAAPVIGVAAAGDGEATVSWDLPVGDNASTLTAYVVTPYIGSVALAPVRFDSTATTQTVAGLTNGVTYRFSVHGINALGRDTARSKLSNPVTPAGLLLAAGTHHTCAVRDDGSVACWGYNFQGQLGNGTRSDSTTPVTVPGLADAVAVTTGDLFSCALLADGTARCWGNNSWGELGNGTTTRSVTPVAVTGLTNAVAISAGSHHACALLGDGTARCWGPNSEGELGTGPFTGSSSVPVTVAGLANATSITAGANHTCAMVNDGTARCWGDNGSGQVGNGPGTDAYAPVAVTGLTSTISLSAGDGYTCALRADRTGRCWGSNAYGGLGDGTTTTRSTPVVVTGLTNAVAITTGGFSSCAVLGDGTARCWGRNLYGQLGNGTTTDSTTPVTVSGVTGAVNVTVGGEHACAVLGDSTATCWGHNRKGQLGNGLGPGSTTPIAAVGLTTATGISAGGEHSCAVLSDATARCWGENHAGHLGNGWPKPDSATPVTVWGLTNAAAIAAGGNHSCALLADGTARCWGTNDRGQLGDGADEGEEYDSGTPVAVVGLTDAVAITAGGYAHSCALKTDGTARCWGDNTGGQLGIGANDWPNTSPVAVTGLTDAVAITAGGSHTCALLGDGAARCWGYNSQGGLGNGTTTSSSTPVTVAGLTDAVAIAAGSGFTCALLGDGTARCWGDNASGQLGNGTTTATTTPVTVTGLTSAVAITAGHDHACALLEDGTARCWGYTRFGGELGNGTSSGSTTPVAVSGLTNATNITSAAYHTCAALDDGTVRCWGSNIYGQLGDGIGNKYTTPMAVVGL
jgi:alpha-tubulin suppressor-like RCC1 family protein